VYHGGVGGELRVDVAAADKIEWIRTVDTDSASPWVSSSSPKITEYRYQIGVWFKSSFFWVTRSGSKEDASEAKAYGLKIMHRLLKLPLVHIPWKCGDGTLFMLTGCENTSFGKMCRVSVGKGIATFCKKFATPGWVRMNPRRTLYFPLERLVPLTEPAIARMMEYRDKA